MREARIARKFLQGAIADRGDRQVNHFHSWRQIEGDHPVIRHLASHERQHLQMRERSEICQVGIRDLSGIDSDVLQLRQSRQVNKSRTVNLSPCKT